VSPRVRVRVNLGGAVHFWGWSCGEPTHGVFLKRGVCSSA